MTSDELLDRLAHDCEQPRDVVRDIVASLADTVETELRARRSLTIPGIGAIHVFQTTDKARPVKLAWYSDEGLRQRIASAIQSTATGAGKAAGERKPRPYTKSGKSSIVNRQS